MSSKDKQIIHKQKYLPNLIQLSNKEQPKLKSRSKMDNTQMNPKKRKLKV